MARCGGPYGSPSHSGKHQGPRLDKGRGKEWPTKPDATSQPVTTGQRASLYQIGRKATMVKQFCDVCGEELDRNYIDRRLDDSVVLEGRRVLIVVHAGIAPTHNSGELCLECLLAAVAKLGEETELQRGG